MAAAAERIRSTAAPLLISVTAAGTALLLPWWAAILLVLLPLVGWTLLQNPQRWVIGFLGAVILLPPLPLPGGDSGPHPAVLLAGAGILLGIARLPDWRISINPLNAAFALLVAALAISIGPAAIHSGEAIATASAARVVLFSLSVFVYFAVSQGPDRSSGNYGMACVLFWIALTGAAFGCLDFAFQLPAPAGFEPQFLWLDSGVYRRAQGLFYEASTLGNFCAFFLVMCAAALADTRRFVSRPALALGIVIFAGAMLLSFSRASVLACGVSLFTLAILERRRWQQYRGLVAMTLLVPIAILAFSWLLPEVAAGYWARIGMSFDRILESPDRVLSGRLESWRILASFIAEHPWETFFGIGYKTLPYTEYLGRPIIADNMYLSLLVETGVAGLLALLGLNAAILAACWRSMRRGSFFGKWMFCFWVGEAFQMLSGDILTYWRVLPVYFWVLAQAVKINADSAD